MSDGTRIFRAYSLLAIKIRLVTGKGLAAFTEGTRSRTYGEFLLPKERRMLIGEIKYRNR